MSERVGHVAVARSGGGERGSSATARCAAGSRQKGVCFYFFGAEKNQHAPALHLLNMRHAATQTRPGVCRIHFHLRHLIVSRRSPCSRGCRDKSAVHVWRGRVLAAATADRLGESSEFRALVFGNSVSLAFIGTRFAPSFAVCREDDESECVFVSRGVSGSRRRALWPSVLEWNDVKRRERVNRATLHSLLSSTSDR